MKKIDKLKRKIVIKETILKILHIICYILSALFIAVCVIAGVKSCDKIPQPLNLNEESSLRINKKLLPQSFSNYFCYSFKYPNPSTVHVALSDQQIYSGGIDLSRMYTTSQTTRYNSYFRGSGYCYLSNSNLIEFERFTFSFSTYPGVEYGSYYFRLNSIFIYDTDGNYHVFISKKEAVADDIEYSISGNYVPKLYLTEEITDNLFISSFFELEPTSNFTFNKQFNYNAPLNTTIEGLYGSGSFTSVLSDSAYIIYNTGYFLSNNQIFNQIKVWFFKTGAIDVQFSNGVGRAPSGYYVYGMIEYNNTDTNYSITVNVHDSIPYQTSGGGYTYYYANSSTWKNDSFRYITFLNSLSDSLTISINSFNNNNQNYYSGQIYNDGYDVFTLLSFGFNSLTEFWQLQILPGISIGVLFFLPTVVGVIITIVHLLRK